jgi:APA family basic amino acid/polyamine antiporter
MAGFLVGWLSFFAIFSGTIATLAVGVTLSLKTFIGIGPTTSMIIAIAVIWIASAVNAYQTRAGALLNTVTAYLKLVALVALVVLGSILAQGRTAPAPFASAGEGSLSSFGVALYPVIFSYLGWNASVFVAGEIDHPGKNLPRSLFLGLAICTAVYLLITATFVNAIGMEKMVGMPDVGFQAGRVLFGEKGSYVVSAVMLASVFGCLNANVLVGPRIAYAMAEDGLFFRTAAKLNAKKTPYVAVLVQGLFATFLLVVFGTKNVDKVLAYTTFAVVLATIADTTALYVLRAREPERPRPYRAAGYPVLPALYILANVAIAISMILSKPVECAIGAVVLLAGAPTYLVFRKRLPPT